MHKRTRGGFDLQTNGMEEFSQEDAAKACLSLNSFMSPQPDSSHLSSSGSRAIAHSRKWRVMSRHGYCYL
jgi:hypothetical protein